MGKGKGPRKPRDPVRSEPANGEEATERQTQDKAALVPPGRRPPTAVGAETPPPPPKQPPPPARTPSPSPQRRPVVLEHYPPALLQLAHAIRAAVGTLLDFADAAAEAITKGIEGRA